MNLRQIRIKLLFVFLIISMISCFGDKNRKKDLAIKVKTEGWITNNLYVTKAYGISDSKLKGEEVIINAKKSAVLNAQQKILGKFRRLSMESHIDKTVKGQSILEIIQMGKILHHNCNQNRCTISYGVEFEDLKNLVKKSNLDDFVLVN